MIGETRLVFEYTPKIEECPECCGDVYVEVFCDCIGQPFRYWACQDCGWHETMKDWIPLAYADWWDWWCFPALSDDSQWELKTRRVVKE